MKVIDPGHHYELADADGGAAHELLFAAGPAGSRISVGTTTEEVIRVLIDRLYTLQKALPCEENVRALHGLQDAYEALQGRELARVAAGVEGTHRPHG